MIILGIETSCDETAAALVENGTKILSNVVASSIKLHQKTGGIIPEVAAREQLKFIIPVIKKALSGTSYQKINALAVTAGPGLIGSLLVGVETAKTLAFAWKKPLIPINHLQAHLYANFLEKEKLPQFPALGLVVSGGHTDLVLIKSQQQIQWLGGTRDDAAGECFDKSGRLLGLPYPGGPAISQVAKPPKNKSSLVLPRPMIHRDNFDFSFSGLKTAVFNAIKKTKKIEVAAFAYEIQEAITDILVAKTKKAADKFKVKSILLAGGVTANPRLREKIKATITSCPLYIPPANLCTDNAAIVAANAFFNFQPLPLSKIQADSSLEIEEMIKST